MVRVQPPRPFKIPAKDINLFGVVAQTRKGARLVVVHHENRDGQSTGRAGGRGFESRRRRQNTADSSTDQSAGLRTRRLWVQILLGGPTCPWPSGLGTGLLIRSTWVQFLPGRPSSQHHPHHEPRNERLAIAHESGNAAEGSSIDLAMNPGTPLMGA